MGYLSTLRGVQLEDPKTKSTRHAGRGIISRRKFAWVSLDLNLEVQVSLKKCTKQYTIY